MLGVVTADIDLGSAFGRLDIWRMTFQEIICIGAYTNTDQDFRHTVQAIFERRLRPLDCTEKNHCKMGKMPFYDVPVCVAFQKIILSTKM